MNLDELFLEVEKDLGPIDDSELDRESLRTPYLFNKYLKFLVTVSIAYKNVEENFIKMRLEKYHYYTGKADPEVYKNEPFDLKVMKTDVHMYLDADDDLSKMRKSLEYSKQRIEYVEKTLKNIQDRNWNIKNAIEWRKFKEGAN